MPQGVRPSDQAENNKTALRQRRNWLIKAASASKEIRLLLAPHSREHPVSHGKPGRAKQQKQQALNNNKNRARTNLGGSFGSPSSFRSSDPRLPPFYTPSPYTMLESAAIMRSSFRMPSKQVAEAGASVAFTVRVRIKDCCPQRRDALQAAPRQHMEQAGHYTKQCIPC